MAAANRLRAFVAGGTQDSFARQERAHASLQAAGYDVTLYEFDAGHTITRAALEELIDWVGRVRS
jgi:predicted esterase